VAAMIIGAVDQQATNALFAHVGKGDFLRADSLGADQKITIPLATMGAINISKLVTAPAATPPA
jgi:hypothetical protein